MIDKDIKLFATDLDGTLYSSFGTLSEYAKNTLIQARKKGIKIVISSGRPYYSIQRTIPDECYDYASCMNGQVIVNRATGERIAKRNLNSEEIKFLEQFIHQYPVVLACSLDDQFIHYCDKNQVWKYQIRETARYIASKITRHKYFHENVITEVPNIEQKEIGKICFSGRYSILLKIYKQCIQNHMSAFFVNPLWLEVQPNDISKGQALLDIMKIEGLTKDQCGAIGDGENDITMLEVVGTPVAMKNAMRNVKAVAKYQADSFFLDGCAHWIENNLLK